MEQALPVLYALAAVAIYNELGVVEAMAYLMKQGYTKDEAVDMLALYDRYVALCRCGQVRVIDDGQRKH